MRDFVLRLTCHLGWHVHRTEQHIRSSEHDLVSVLRYCHNCTWVKHTSFTEGEDK